MEVHRYSGFLLTGMNRPAFTTILNIMRVLALLIPLSFLGNNLWGIDDIFAGRLLTDIVSGTIGIIWVGGIIKSKKYKMIKSSSVTSTA